MRTILGLLLSLLFVSVSNGQSFDFSKYGKSESLSQHERRWESPKQSLGDLRANRYDSRSLSNPYGAGSRYKADGLNNPYSRYGSSYSNDSWRNPYATNPPRMSNGGRLSTNRYLPDSTSNPYGRYGSPYSADSLSNRYGAGNPYQSEPLYVYPGDDDN